MSIFDRINHARADARKNGARESELDIVLNAETAKDMAQEVVLDHESRRCDSVFGMTMTFDSSMPRGAFTVRRRPVDADGL